MKVLVIEDEHKIANSIKKGLEQESFAVDVCFNGTDGFDMAMSEHYDVILLDLMLPDMNGIEICKNLRLENNHTPILMLTAKGQLEDKVEGLNCGADDYMVKPFAFVELLARIKALGRRPAKGLGTELKIDDLILNTNSFSVTRSGKEIRLTKQEYSLLEYLMRHVGSTIGKNQIIASVWDYSSDILPNTVEVYIGYLRNKIDKKFPDRNALIHTIRGFGYKIGKGKR
jgi:two-component system copper resistance phosphate regulon response regulator CusR